MPFDGSNKAKDRGYQLVYALRNLPQTHKWDFSYIGGDTGCGSHGCAIGLAKALWGDWHSSTLYDVIGVHNYDNIFFRNERYNVSYDEVTPEMVANALEEALNNAL